MIEINNLSCHYRKKEVISNLDININEGKLIGIIGRNGSGKTTLLKAIMDLINYEGVIKVDGEVLDIKTRARLISYMPQFRIIPDLSVLMMVNAGRYPLNKGNLESEKCLEYLELLGIKELAFHNVKNLSGGERQKAYLAMCLAQETKYILLDEPSTYLDIDAKIELWEILKKIVLLDKTIIIVSHEVLDVIEHCDEVMVIDKGKALYYGNNALPIIKEIFHIKEK